MTPPDGAATATSSAPTVRAGAAEAVHLDLLVGGMTCAACAARIEKRLNKMDGVVASVNFATETAAVDYDPACTNAETMIGTVTALGYTAAVPTPDADEEDAGESAALRNYRKRLLVSLPLTIPVMFLGMRHGFDFGHIGHMEPHPGRARARPERRGTRQHPRDRAHARRRARAHRARRALGRAAVPPRRLAEPARTARRRWTRSSRSAPCRPSFGRSGRCSPAARRSTSRSPQPSRRSCCSAAGPRRARAAAPAGRCASSWLSAPRKCRSCATTASRNASTSGRCASATGSSSAPARRSRRTASSKPGVSALDMSMITGESVPVERGPGDEVVGAAMNVNGRLVMRVTKIGSETALAQIARMVANAPRRQGPRPAPGRPGGGHLRPDRHPDRARHARDLADRDRRRGPRVHRDRRRPDHRLPVRARPGHAHGAARRHRPRRPTRPAHQRPRGAGVHPAGRHHRPGQDRHRDQRQDDRARRCRRRGDGRVLGPASRRRPRETPRSTRSAAPSPPTPPSGWRSRATPSPRSPSSSASRAWASSARWTASASSSAGRPC